jgi:hypothetical protein
VVGATPQEGIANLQRMFKIDTEHFTDHRQLPDGLAEFMGLSDGEGRQWGPA